MRFSLVLFTAIALTPIVLLNDPATAHAGRLTNNSSDQSLFNPILIDFEEFAAGTYIVGNEWAEFGLNITVNSTLQRKDGSGSSLPLRLYNSNCSPNNKTKDLPKCTGDDGDLATGKAYGTDPQGNVLIIQEDNSKRNNRSDLGAPDDDTRGGTITFNFDQAVSLLSLGFLDFDDRDRGAGFIRAYTGAEDTKAAVQFSLGDVDYLVNPKFTGNNSIRKFDQFGDTLFRRLEVQYPGSGAITHLEFGYPVEVAPGGSAYWAEKSESTWW